jgi:hypothetical protein
MAEWLKAHAWKACVPQGTVGSNPTLSARLPFSPVQRSLQSPILALEMSAYRAEGAAIIRALAFMQLRVDPKTYRQYGCIPSSTACVCSVTSVIHHNGNCYPACVKRQWVRVPQRVSCSRSRHGWWGSDRCTEIGQNIPFHSVDAVPWTPRVAWSTCAREKRGASSSSGRG